MAGSAPVVVYANWFQCAPAQRMSNPQVHSRMLLWCEAGAGTVEVNDERFALGPDDFLVLPWRHHVSYAADAADPFLLGGVHVIPHHARGRPVDFSVAHTAGDPAARDGWRRDDPETATPSVLSGTFTWAPRLRMIATYIVERYAHEPRAEQPMRDLAGLLLDEIAAAVAERGAATVEIPAALHRMQLFIRDHYAERLTVGRIASVGECSPATVHRLFNGHLGKTPYGYVVEVRMRAARQLLRTTGRPVADIAGEVGFDDPFHFSRAFRRAVGASPVQYRASRPRI